ncbi:MAG: Holliday junction branch migration protein RuvA [Firmicutes bacterium]|nr:Holliday junction branch migration protein RuvA [Bacillota bacterium]
MIAFIDGTVVDALAAAWVVQVGSFGLRIDVLPSVAAAPPIGQQVRLYTSLHRTETKTTLYGFARADERDLFETLIGISGIGPKGALALIDTLGVEGLIRAVATQNVSALAEVRGFGKKSAERLLITLQQHSLYTQMPDAATRSEGDRSPSTLVDDLCAGLQAMGYAAQEAERAVTEALRTVTSRSEQEILRHALQLLAPGVPISTFGGKGRS